MGSIQERRAVYRNMMSNLQLDRAMDVDVPLKLGEVSLWFNMLHSTYTVIALKSIVLINCTCRQMAINVYNRELLKLKK